MTALNAVAGAVARDSAVDAVGAAANAAWKTYARQWIIYLANTRLTFTSDDVWASGVPKPREPRALGAVFREVARAGIIESVGYRQTIQVLRHRAPIRIWRKK